VSSSPFLSFEYTLSLSVPYFIPVAIDIKPGSHHNCVSNKGHRVIPVAILSNRASGFDATQVDPSTITLNGLSVKAGWNGRLETYSMDVNHDRKKDLLVEIENIPWAFKQDTTEAELIGELYDGSLIRGIDSICIIPSHHHPWEWWEWWKWWN
jgi:hypothetical protein